MDIFERFSRIIDNYSFHQVGCLFIYDEGEFLAAESEREMQHRAGAKFEVLRRKDMEQRFPALNIKDNEYCVLDLRGGWNKSSTIGFRPPRAGTLSGITLLPLASNRPRVRQPRWAVFFDPRKSTAARQDIQEFFGEFTRLHVEDVRGDNWGACRGQPAASG